ncbi:GntR family transcriptional regulator [Sphingomonas albertensis]|uniref:GntR family transcriptional regulator n=1 Tax=Sphingomonas albertensis TaxID=2762591 RepID=A0ABR7AIV8_9SPHN|nr:GntR family transcriptional regulator [Sphingomonas albertensis]MBC3940393.1 GntR family transcriptional regulator [Sphingomonas albertensis]
MSIVVRTLSEQVFEIVREQIVTGKLAGHSAIRQDALATELGVSKIPLREALARLEQEGLLTSHANRGYSVQPMSADEADDIFALRLSIEPQAAAYASTVANDADRATAILAFEELDSAASERLAEVAIRNRVFHTALVRPGRRLLTTQMVERLAILAERYVVAHLRPAGREDRAHLEHRQMLGAWLARDDDRMLTLLTSHIQSTLTDLRFQFASARE